MGGDRLSLSLSPISCVARLPATPKLPISLLVGEMSGRTEGGAVEHGTEDLALLSALPHDPRPLPPSPPPRRQHLRAADCRHRHFPFAGIRAR
ncbi:MAG: hypothetical protein EOS21_18350 [Mesorhizobium sp.]|nr:MAG: hypothetical protein EOS21_18350 [Mesorhizobium sp.]